MRILGIDYGEARVGIAITDDNNEVETIVVGMPLHMNGDISERAKATRRVCS